MKRNTYLISYFLVATMIIVFLCGCESNGPANFDTIYKNENTIKNEDISKNKKVQDTEEEKVTKYIEENTVNLSGNNTSELSSLLKEDLKDNRIFLRNTEYGVSADYDVDFNLLKYLNKEAGVNYYLRYISYSKAQIINKYICSGDESVLECLVDSDNIVSLEEVDLWKKIYEYNKTLSEDKKIHVLGCEIEGQNENCCFIYLNMLIPEKTPPEKISEYIKDIQNYEEKFINNDELLELVNIYEDLEKNQEIYKEYLGDNFEEFKLVLLKLKKLIEIFIEDNGITNVNEYYKLIKGNLKNIIFDNMNCDDNIKFYGNLPLNEIFGSNTYIKEAFISELKDELSVNEKFIMVNTIYNKCRKILSNSGSISLDSDFEHKEIINQNIKYDTALINLSREKSLFNDKNKNCQFAVYLYNSNAEKPLRLTNLDVEEENKLRDFLNDNKYIIDIRNGENFELLSKLELEFNKYDVIFTGESHATSYNYDIKLQLLKYYNQKFGLRYYLDEGGYASGQLINEYLKTGDEKILKSIFDNLKGTFEFNKQSYEFYKKLYEYNKTLPENEKIIIVGVDVEHQQNTAWKYVNTLIPDEEPPVSIAEEVKKLKHKFTSSKEDKENLEWLLQDIDKNTVAYEEYFGDNYFDFVLTANNILNSIEFHNNEGREGYKAASQIRERSIYENFLKVYNYLPKGRYYGQWGREHIYQHTRSSQYIDEECFAQKLNGDDSPVKGRVLSIPCIYMNSMYMDRTNGRGVPAYNNYQQALLFSDISEGEVTLFKLKGKNSPFEEKTYIVDNAQGGVTTDYFQYVILVKNSKATELYNPCE